MLCLSSNSWRKKNGKKESKKCKPWKNRHLIMEENKNQNSEDEIFREQENNLSRKRKVRALTRLHA